MSNYELYEHKKSDTVKWVLTLIAFIVVGVLIAGLIAGWFDKGEDSLPVQDETAAAVQHSRFPGCTAEIRIGKHTVLHSDFLKQAFMEIRSHTLYGKEGTSVKIAVRQRAS